MVYIHPAGFNQECVFLLFCFVHSDMKGVSVHTILYDDGITVWMKKWNCWRSPGFFVVCKLILGLMVKWYLLLFCKSSHTLCAIGRILGCRKKSGLRRATFNDVCGFLILFRSTFETIYTLLCWIHLKDQWEFITPFNRPNNTHIYSGNLFIVLFASRGLS